MLQKQKIAILFLFVSRVAISQHDVRCDSAYAYFDSLRMNTVGLMRYDKAPVLVDSHDLLFLASNDSLEAGKIFVEFLINIEGKAQCPRVIMSQKMELNDSAILRIERLNFIPAEQNGLPIISTRVLPLRFGQKNILKNKGRTKRNKS